MNLFSLFYCFKCKQGEPTVTMKSSGTIVTVYQSCFKCGENAYQWRSQLLILGKYPAENFASELWSTDGWYINKEIVFGFSPSWGL